MTFRPDPKPYVPLKEPKGKKQKFPKITGELQLFKKIFYERGCKCEITGEKLAFNVKCFMHVLSKGSRPDLRLEPENIFMVKYRIHWLYDNGTEEMLLREFPGAKIIFERKEELKTFKASPNNASADELNLLHAPEAQDDV